MDDVYTPTTDGIRGMFANATGWTFGPHENSLDLRDIRDQQYAKFDRWLAAHDAEVAAVAWDKAVASLVYEDGAPVEVLTVTNPYRNQNTRLREDSL